MLAPVSSIFIRFCPGDVQKDGRQPMARAGVFLSGHLGVLGCTLRAGFPLYNCVFKPEFDVVRTRREIWKENGRGGGGRASNTTAHFMGRDS